MTIRVLDPTVAAQIAAGEVVERPASVVREIVENAIDAGARKIAVEIRDGGLREITVRDDGRGIAADEVELAFTRHATSKLSSADDLWAIGTLGFRGEALPSIASVAQVICTTRAADEEVGVELRIAGGEVQARSPRGCSPGTAISVRNLFYNTPVRREFLRSEATESAAVAATVTQYALAYPEIRFTLAIEGRITLQTAGAGELRAALIEIYGLDAARQLLPVEATVGEDDAAVSISGLVSPPGLTRSSRSAIHLYVNRRAILPRGQPLYVLEEAYHTLMMKGRHPMAVLNIALHPGTVDVNVHPTKSEVKFRDAPRVMSAIGRAVRDALLEGGVRPWADASEPSALDIAQRRFELRRVGSAWEQAAAPRQGQWQIDGRDAASFAPPDPLEQTSGSPLAAPTPLPPHRLPPLRVVGQIHNAYILAETPEGMYLIDQHAAHERVTYERLMTQRASGAIERQELLMAQIVELSPEAEQTLLANDEQLGEWGFTIEPFGEGMRVRAMPATVAIGELSRALAEIADNLGGRGGATPADRREAMLITLSCHTSVRAGQRLSPEEIEGLLASLERCDSPRTCPHGRPTMILLTHTQIERQFGRIK